MAYQRHRERQLLWQQHRHNNQYIRDNMESTTICLRMVVYNMLWFVHIHITLASPRHHMLAVWLKKCTGITHQTVSHAL